MLTLLLIDPDPRRAAQVEETLRRAGHVIWSCTTPGQALKLLDRGRFDVVLAASDLRTMTGARLLEITAEMAPDAVRFLRSSSQDLEAAVDAVASGLIARFLPEPCDDQLLREAVEWAATQLPYDSGPPMLGLRLSA